MATHRPTASRVSLTPLQWAVQIFGELLITLGCVLILFVAWQLWWTNIAANSAQKDAVQSLVQEFDATPEADAVEETHQAQGAENAPSSETYDPLTPPITQAPAYGEVYGVVYIPRLGEGYARPLAEGVGADVLDTLGLGRYPGTQLPGEYGNLALAGHRQTNGAVLDHIDELQTGDAIYVRTAQGYYTYRVYESTIVLPHQVRSLPPTPMLLTPRCPKLIGDF